MTHQINRADPAQVLTPVEVAQIFRVDAKTVARWAKDGRLPSFRTLGGHRRYLAGDVQEALRGASQNGGA